MFYVYCVSVLLTFGLFRNVCPSCVFQDGKYNLSALNWPTGWPVEGPVIDGTVTHYEISVCQPLNYASPLKNGCPKSSVCHILGNKSISYGNAMEDISDYAIADSIGNGFSLFLLTKTSCGSSGVYRATINFVCGPHLGAPELILRNDCQVNFYWRTSAACPDKPNNHEVPCYIIDNEGNKRDLSHLIQNRGGYFVNTPNPSVDFVINVCSNILSDSKTEGCPENASACRILGREHLSFGNVKERLQFNQEGLELLYETDSPDSVPGCQLKPKTTVLFKCPPRGYNQPPKLISDSNCQFEVEWETEYACPENMLKGNLKTCQFTADLHGIEIDLSPLKKKSVYTVLSNSSNTTFALSVCGGLGNIICGGTHWKFTAVCLINSTSNTSEVVGRTDGSKLMYADGEVILTYPKGTTCEDGVNYSSVINFICDPNASNDGEGEPRHVLSNHCIHIFEWSTKFACLKHPLDTPCSVTYDKKKVNLQKLLLSNGEAWEAVDRRNGQSKNNDEYYINVCGQVSNLGNLSACGAGSSICIKKINGEYLNLGNFTSPPVYDATSNSVKLTYIGGSPCRDKKLWKSAINFICNPGHINSEPSLISINEEDCSYEFEWHTAEACPEGMIEGSNCKVYDSNLGINYDLSPLKSKTYVIDSELYEFYMGICEPIVDSPCSKDQSSKKVGVCQVDKINKTSWKTGEPSSHLSYMDGVVNLTYLSGDPYNDQNQTSRMTIIIFICDYNAGNGKPHFFEEVNFVYVFHWYTGLVCTHSVSMECMAHDPFSHIIYDLSGLSLADQNWMTIINENEKERKIYMNVCRSLALPVGCDSTAAACVVEDTNDRDKVILPNIGQALSPPVLDSPGHLILTYTNGDPCVAFGQNITYSTIIHFLCAEDKMSVSGLRFLNKVGACEYAFLWTTKAACPTGNLMSNETCQLTDPDSGFTFDLTSLYRENPYVISSPSGIFQFNICGKVIDGCYNFEGKPQSKNVSVCEVDNNGKLISEIALADSYNLSYSTGRDLSLIYKSDFHSVDGPRKVVVIRFPCHNSTTDPKFIKAENKQLIFEMKTSLTCIPSHFNCNVIDEFSNEYDLSPLAKYNGNWEVTDNRPGYFNLRYHINFCRPLNKVTAYTCPGGASAACQTSAVQTESSGYDLGSHMNQPVVSSKGTVVIRYTDGSYCHNEQFRRSTTINLFCSHDDKELKFIGETPECEYIFSLETPAACPVQSSHGDNCIVKDPLFGYMFNLNPLKSKNNNYNITVGDYRFLFNVCDKLNGLNNECSNSSACQMKPQDPKFSKSLGLPNDVLRYRKGKITLEYKSGSGNCHEKFNRSTSITFICNHGHEDRDGPSFIAEAQNCSYLFEWPTVHACPPFDVIECSVVDNNGMHYDLSKLSLPGDNYYIKSPFSDKKTFVINICRSVVHTADSLCPYTSAACLIDSSNVVEPVNLGRVSQMPYFENGKIKINYTSGDPCDEEDTLSARFFETVIEFTCDESSIESEPEFVGKDGCTYYFDWSTIFACPSKTPVSTDDCTLQDPLTGYIFNFSSLRNHGIFKTHNNHHQYYVSICGNDSISPCGSEAGVCQEEISGSKRHWSAGKPNNDLIYNGDILYLNYTGGDPCHNGRFQRNTIMEFYCGHGIGEPKFVSESYDCTYFFSWKTELACQPLLHCAVKNGSHYYDLTGLAKSYHVAGSSVLNDNALYYVSVCNPLYKIPGISCPPESALCRITRDPQSAVMITESLGKLDYPPFIDFMGHATVIYTNGSVCRKNMNIQNRARIIFLCDAEAGMGEPVLLEEDDECLFVFEWRTNIVCPEKPEVPSLFTSCNYSDQSRGIHFDLLPLQRNGEPSYYQVKAEGNKEATFYLNVCGNLQGSNISKCIDSGICVKEGNAVYSYGLASSQKFTFDGQRLRLTFYDGDDCPSGLNGKRTSEIFFICDQTAGLGKPVLHKKYTCLAVFMWKTALVCQNAKQQCSFDVGNNHYDFSLLSSLSHNWNTSDNKNTYYINLCRGIQPTRETSLCSPAAVVCMVDPSGFHVPLGMAQSIQVKLINTTDLLLTFESGDERACSSLGTNKLSPMTRLFMRCGTSLGSPKIFSGPDSKCFYDFIWESSLACADKAEEVMVEKDGVIQDSRLDFSFDIKSILNQTFTVPGASLGDDYIYIINLSGVSNVSDLETACGKAAICQTKPFSTFRRDIGSFDTRTFILRGAELHLTFVSHTKPCGKNTSKNVTTLINLQCVSSAGIGSPVFLYESGNCDYIFEWETIVVCPDFHRKKTDDHSSDNNPQTDPFKDESHSSHKAEIAVGVISAIVVVMVIMFVVMKSERRTILSSRFRSLFGRVSVPYFRYKRADGERLVLVDATQALHYDDERDVELLT